MFYFNCVEFSVRAGNAESVISPKVVTLFDVKQWKLLLMVSGVGLAFGAEKFQGKGRNPEALQAKFDGVVLKTAA